MSAVFDEFLKDNHDRIGEIADNLKSFEIQAKTVGISQARERINQWLQNFDKLNFRNFELPLHLLEKIQFIKTSEISDNLIKDADPLIIGGSAYIAPLGETIESSFKITSKLHRNERFATALSSLLDKLDEEENNQILFFDDFLNSGGQLVSIFCASSLISPLPNGEINDEAQSRSKLNTKQISRLKKAEIHLFYYLAFIEGISKVEERLKKELGLNITIHAHFATNNNASAFGDAGEQENIREGATGKISHNSIFQGKTFKEVSDFYRFIRDVGELLLRTKEPLWEESKYAARSLGYGNLGRVVMTDSNVPTVTLTALWQDAGITFNGTTVKWVELLPRTKKILNPADQPVEQNSVIENKSLDFINTRLQQLYETDYIDQGVEEVNEAYKIHGVSFKLMRHLFRFNLRAKNWEKIRTATDGLNFKELSDELVTLCKFALFECELRESYALFKKDKLELVKRIQRAKRFLNDIPASQHDYEEYYYWNGRWFLETWYVGENSDITILRYALACMEKAMNKKSKWYYQCYRCIILKLLKNENSEAEIDHYFQTMKKGRFEKPDRPSVRTYSITSFVLKNDAIGLNQYLQEINKPSSPSDFQSTIFQHIDLVCYFEKAKNKKYKKILEKWIANLPIK